MVPVVVQYILSLVVSLPSSLWNHQSPNYQSNVWIENRPIMFMPLTQPTINLVRPFQLRVSWTSQSTAWNWGSRFISIPLCVLQFASTHTVIPHPCQRCSVELTPSCLAAYLWAADNCSLDNVKLAHTEEWGLLKKLWWWLTSCSLWWEALYNRLFSPLSCRAKQQRGSTQNCLSLSVFPQQQ